MRQSYLYAAIAARMRQALENAGLSLAEAARRLGYKQSTFNRWLTGKRRPADADIEAFAALVDVSPEQITKAGSDALVDSILDWLNVVQQGPNPVEAFSEVGVNVDRFSPELRQALLREEARIRADVAAMGGSDWQALTEEQRRAIAEQIRDLAEANRRQKAQS